MARSLVASLLLVAMPLLLSRISSVCVQGTFKLAETGRYIHTASYVRQCAEEVGLKCPGYGSHLENCSLQGVRAFIGGFRFNMNVLTSELFLRVQCGGRIVSLYVHFVRPCRTMSNNHG